jgi:hypothetical protein
MDRGTGGTSDTAYLSPFALAASAYVILGGQSPRVLPLLRFSSGGDDGFKKNVIVDTFLHLQDSVPLQGGENKNPRIIATTVHTFSNSNSVPRLA